MNGLIVYKYIDITFISSYLFRKRIRTMKEKREETSKGDTFT